MSGKGIFGGIIPTLEKSLDLRSLRQTLITSNIANKDTPNYKAFDLAVEEELKKAEDGQGSLTLEKTDSSHYSNDGSGDMYAAVSQSRSSNQFESSLNGNTVDIENEMMNLAENNIMYDAMAQIIRQKFQSLLSAIQGGAR